MRPLSTVLAPRWLFDGFGSRFVVGPSFVLPPSAAAAAAALNGERSVVGPSASAMVAVLRAPFKLR